jgi:arylsulfatase A-like enzyme
MSRERAVRGSLAAAAFLSLAAGCARAPETPRGAIVLLIDTCRADEVGSTVTPNLVELAQTATTFPRATSPAPWTLPAVASLLTSTYPTVHGAAGRYPEFGALRGVRTGAEVLADAGVRTAAIVNCPFLDPALGLGRGFDRFDYYAEHGPEIRTAAETLDGALAWLRGVGGERFFLFVHLFDAHMDFDPPEPWRSRFLEGEPRPLEGPFAGVTRWRRSGAPPEVRRYARALYRAELAAVDDAIGRFVDALAADGLLDEIALVVTADHGEEFWEHGQFEHGHTLYEELIRVPLLVRAPGRGDVREIGARVGLVDVLPTLCDLLGVAPPAGFEGRSLVPLLEGKRSPGETEAYSEAILYGPEWKAITGERWKLVRREDDGSIALFDLEADPGETRNLAESDAARVRAMEARLDDWIRRCEARAESVPAAAVVDMDAEVMSRLRTLGYAD